jgi:cell division protein FtsB
MKRQIRELLARANQLTRDVESRLAGLQAEANHLAKERTKLEGQIEILEHLLTPAPKPEPKEQPAE